MLVRRTVSSLPFTLFVLLFVSVSQADDRAEATLKTLTTRFHDAKADREKLRLDLLAFRRVHFGSPQALVAADLLAALPSPLDRLDAAAIPALDRFDWQPKELVAVLGEHRCRHGYPVSAVAWSPDGKTVISGSSVLRLWDPATMRQRDLLGYGSSIAIYSKDGKTLALAYSSTVNVLDMAGDKPKGGSGAAAGTSGISGLALSPSAKVLAAACADTQVRLWDVNGVELKEKHTLSGHTGAVYAVAFSPDGRMLASAGADNTIRLWDMSLDPPKEGAVIEGHPKEVTALAFSPDGHTLLSAGADGALFVWEMSGFKPGRRAVLPKAHAGWIYNLAITASGRTLATASADATVKVWDLLIKEPKERSVLEGHVGPVTGVAWSPDATSLATCGSDWTVRLWTFPVGAKPKQKFDLHGHLSHPYALALTPDGQTLASGSADATVRLWGLGGKEGKERSLLKGDGVAIYTLAMAPDGKTLAAGGNHVNVRLWDVVLGREVRKFQDAPGGINMLAFGPDGREVAGSSGKYVCLWETAGGKELRRFEHKSAVAALALAPDGKRLLTGSGEYQYGKDGRILYKDGVPLWADCCMRQWDVERGDELHQLTDFALPVSSVAFSADGRTAFSGDSESQLRYWDLTGEAPKAGRAIKGASGGVTKITVAPDGKSMATSGPDGKLIVWDAASGKRLHEWTLPEYFGGLAFASDSRHLAVALGTGPVYVLRLDVPRKSGE
jgi:WD40 repeat protein